MSAPDVVAAVAAEVAQKLGAPPPSPRTALVWRAVLSGDPADAGIEAVAIGRAWQLGGRVAAIVPDAHDIDELLVVSRSRPLAGRDRGLRVHRIPAGAGGVRLARASLLDGVALTVELDGALVTDDDALGPPRDASAALSLALDTGSILAVDDMLDAAQAALDLATAWVSQRQQFGAALATRQAVQHRAADMAIVISAVRGLLDDAKQAASNSKDFAVEAAMAKLVASERLPDVTAGAHQLHGGEGYYADRGLHELHRRVLTLATLLGDPARQRRRLADLLATLAP
jgi:alkylation response protein AidB-like acyl-CoA dehydrogenase